MACFTDHRSAAPKQYNPNQIFLVGHGSDYLFISANKNVVITDTNLSGDTKLLDAIKFDLVSKAEGDTYYTVYDGAEGIVLPDEGKNLDEKTFYLRGTMDTAAGNEYKGLTLSGIIITVYATQYTYEYDSEDNLYDEDAEYDDGTAGGETNPDPEPTVDKTALNKAIEDAGKLKADDYVDFSAVTEAVEAANNLPANATQEQVDAAAKAITDAITALQDKPVINKNALVEKIEEAKGIQPEYAYTPNSWAALQNAITSAEAVNNDAEATQDEVNAAVEALSAAMTAVTGKADKGALATAITNAEALTEADYVDFSAVTTALASANTVNADDNATQTEVDNAAKALNDAIEALVKKANKTNLAAAIEAATKLNSDDYVDFSAVTTALASANTVNAKIDATQTEVDNATEALNNAVSALEKKPALLATATGHTNEYGCYDEIEGIIHGNTFDAANTNQYLEFVVKNSETTSYPVLRFIQDWSYWSDNIYVSGASTRFEVDNLINIMSNANITDLANLSVSRYDSAYTLTKLALYSSDGTLIGEADGAVNGAGCYGNIESLLRENMRSGEGQYVIVSAEPNSKFSALRCFGDWSQDKSVFLVNGDINKSGQYTVTISAADFGNVITDAGFDIAYVIMHETDDVKIISMSLYEKVN